MQTSLFSESKHVDEQVIVLLISVKDEKYEMLVINTVYALLAEWLYNNPYNRFIL